MYFPIVLKQIYVFLNLNIKRCKDCWSAIKYTVNTIHGWSAWNLLAGILNTVMIRKLAANYSQLNILYENNIIYTPVVSKNVNRKFNNYSIFLIINIH